MEEDSLLLATAREEASRFAWFVFEKHSMRLNCLTSITSILAFSSSKWVVATARAWFILTISLRTQPCCFKLTITTKTKRAMKKEMMITAATTGHFHGASQVPLEGYIRQ